MRHKASFENLLRQLFTQSWLAFVTSGCISRLHYYQFTSTLDIIPSFPTQDLYRMAGVGRANRKRRLNLGLPPSKQRKEAKKLKTGCQKENCLPYLTDDAPCSAQEKAVESSSTLESEPHLRNPAFSDCIEYQSQGDHSFVDEDLAGKTSDALLKITAYVIVKVTSEVSEGPLVSGQEPAPSTSKEVGTQANTFTKRKQIAMQPSVCTQARRIVSLESLQTAMTEATFHTSVCRKGPVFLKSETKTGMYTEMSFTCGCGKTFAVKSDGEKAAFSINEALVWGNTQSAIGYNASVNLLTTMELPTPSFNYYNKFQQNLHDEMTAALKDELKRWAKMEFELAKAAGDIIIINGKEYALITGAIFRLQDKTDNTATLNDYFGRKKFPSAIRAMQYGTDNEARAIEEYASNCEEKVSRAGFTVYSKNGIFGASPDAYVGDNGLLEVKCPFSLHLKDLNKEGATAWPSVSSASSLQVLNGKLEMKKKHPHYYRVIMQLYVTDRSWCDYMVWSETGKHVIIRISISPETDKLWIRMQEKLEKFWMNDLAPELVDSRFDRGYTEYKCPSYRLSDRVKKSKSKKNKCHVPALTGCENE